jgi:hypothetical protein
MVPEDEQPIIKNQISENMTARIVCQNYMKL